MAEEEKALRDRMEHEAREHGQKLHQESSALEKQKNELEKARKELEEKQEQFQRQQTMTMMSMPPAQVHLFLLYISFLLTSYISSAASLSTARLSALFLLSPSQRSPS